MPDFRCYFFQKDGTSAGWRSFNREGDEEARDYALGLFVGYPHALKVEVWENSRQILSYNRSAAQTPVDLRRLCYLALAAAKSETDPSIKQIIASRALALAQEAEAMERTAR